MLLLSGVTLAKGVGKFTEAMGEDTQFQTGQNRTEQRQMQWLAGKIRSSLLFLLQGDTQYVHKERILRLVRLFEDLS